MSITKTNPSRSSAPQAVLQAVLTYCRLTTRCAFVAVPNMRTRARSSTSWTGACACVLRPPRGLRTVTAKIGKAADAPRSAFENKPSAHHVQSEVEELAAAVGEGRGCAQQ